MRLFLQINIGDWQDQGYARPMLHLASSLADDVIGTDVDTLSEPHVVDLVKKLVSQSQHTFLLVYARNPDQPLNNVLSLFSHLFDCQDKIHLAVFAGEHATAEKLLRTLDEKFVKNDEDELIRKMVKQFARG
ncbi:MAG: hypothetical protein LOY03_11405 [Cyclobacteriaceae bacterium]|jgi:hypothetical protein|nr:hypothetical protein [Cyclobacteriaceae bacterium]